MNESFERGFDFALGRWRAGDAVEVIAQRVDYDASARGRGMFAACEALLGWYDIAEREARAFGFTRDNAARLAARARAV